MCIYVCVYMYMYIKTHKKHILQTFRRKPSSVITVLLIRQSIHINLKIQKQYKNNNLSGTYQHTVSPNKV